MANQHRTFRRCTKLSFLLFALHLSVIGVKEVVADKLPRPNILVFYVDDMGWGSIGPNTQAARKARNLPYVRTPTLDRLAVEGINFTRGYGCHVCSPARSSLQTGFHQGHTFADRNDPNNAKKAIRADDPSIGKSLTAAGYVTGYWGKWGYGGSKDQAKPVIENIQTLPTSQGYKYVLAELHHVRAHTFFQPTLWSAPAPPKSIGELELIPNSMKRYQGDNVWPSTPALQDHADYPETAYCDDAYAFAALDFVRKQGQNYNKTGQPFHGLLAVQIPHSPFGEIATLPEWDSAYADDPHYKSLANQTRQWAAMVTRIDAHFGNILAALDDPNNDGDTSDSIADNTLVVFKSDNGGPGGSCNRELDANGGLSGTKGKIQEGGIRVPLVMRWPAMITTESHLKAGTNCDMVVDVTDLLPTFCELAGVPVPLSIDGVSIAPTLLGSGQQRRREFIIHEAGNGQSIIRGDHKLIRSKNSTLKLFDLKADRAETNDIADKQLQLVKELESLLLGERVAEPRGFANTYHHWTGQDGDKTSVPDNWSDYKYVNDGVNYMTDVGAPRSSWTARIANTSDQPRTTLVDQDLDVLGLEISGNPKTNANQSLILGPEVNLTGRNEIRLASHAKLTINNGSMSTLRWIDIHRDAMLAGHGSIEAIVFNGGTVTVSGSNRPVLRISGDFHQSTDAILSLPIVNKETSAMRISGDATLGGILRIDAGELKRLPGESFKVLTAKRLIGTFSNSNDEAVSSDGTRFAIGYSKTGVTVTVK